jgi:hydrogenase maturation protein HypF
MKRHYIKIYGIVQGVGYRPFIYKLAIKYQIKGFVRNLGGAVFVLYEGNKVNVRHFIYEIIHNPPPLAQIERITTNMFTKKKTINIVKTGITYLKEKEFIIMKSYNNKSSMVFLSPDIAVCEKCLQEMNDEKSRFYRYPFTNCTECGPRYSIIKSLPYDRHTTTMKDFVMCKHCNEEYQTETNRRYHAEPISCNQCGPTLQLTDNQGNLILSEDIIKESIQKIKHGYIFGVKGIGGFHLICDANNKDLISELRKRKRRPYKPFAVMMKDIKTVKKICELSSQEQMILESTKRPIVILKRKSNVFLPANIAPNSEYIGVMLPYAPIHYLLFEEDIECLIMTSGNMNHLPIEYENDKALQSLKNVVDFFILHNRDIYLPIDDSVVKVLEDNEVVSRRSRGYIPYSFFIENDLEIIAFGADLKSTISILNNQYIKLSQYLGDLGEVSCYQNYKRIIHHFITLYGVNAMAVVHDMHPNYYSSTYAKQYANEIKGKNIGVYHHHAHMASCMGEHRINEKVIGVIFDGTGYGIDKAIWGGEFLVGDLTSFTRVGHLEYVLLQGGDETVKKPWHSLVCYLYQLGYDVDEFLPKDLGESIAVLKEALRTQFFCFSSSSIGRLFDAVSALIGICLLNTYDGQAAIELENALITKDMMENEELVSCMSKQVEEYSYPYDISLVDGEYLLGFRKIFDGIIDDIKNGVSVSRISYGFHNTLIEAGYDMILKISQNTGIKTIVLSGGVFENQYLLKMFSTKLKKAGFKTYYNEQIPINDSGISFGQIQIAAELIKRNEEYRCV